MHVKALAQEIKFGRNKTCKRISESLFLTFYVFLFLPLFVFLFLFWWLLHVYMMHWMQSRSDWPLKIPPPLPPFFLICCWSTSRATSLHSTQIVLRHYLPKKKKKQPKKAGDIYTKRKRRKLVKGVHKSHWFYTIMDFCKHIWSDETIMGRYHEGNFNTYGFVNSL